jgi:hypothetical protein
VSENVLRFKVVDGTLVCEGALGYGATVSLYNMGGVLVSSAVAVSDSVTLPVTGQPHGSYVVVVNSGEKQNVYKVLL